MNMPTPEHGFSGIVRWAQTALDPTAPASAPVQEHLHDFHTGALRCTICKLTAGEAGVESGGRIIGPMAAGDDGWRAPDTGRVPPALQGPAIDEAPPITRTDVVARLYDLVRRPGEDDSSLATRIRRKAGAFRPPVPSMTWQPWPGFRLGIDKWQDKAPPAIAEPRVETYTHAIDLGDGQELEL